MDDDVKRLAEERRKKVLANSEARLKKITDLSRSQNPKPPENNFVDFEVDSFVNEPCRVAGRGLEDSPLAANSPPSNYEDTPPQANIMHRLTFEQRPSDDVIPTTSVRTGNHAMEMDFDNFIRDLQSGYAEQDLYSNLGRRQPNGLLINQNNQPNVNNMGIGNLMAEMSSLIAAMQPPGPAPAQQEQLQPIAKPYLVVATFLILGAVARLILQISSYNFNVIVPFLCLAVPLSLMSWGRGRPPVSNLLSAVFIFLPNPRTRAMITNWIRLTSLFRGLCQLFACYLFSFVMIHVLLEVPSLYSDIASTPA